MKSMPRVLVVDFKSVFPDRTDRAFYNSLEKKFEVVYYGPGYVDSECLESDLLKVYDDLGPFDACFCHSKILVYLHKDKNYSGADYFDYNDGVTRYLFDTKKFATNFPKFGLNYDKLPCCKFLIAMLQDFYAFSDWHDQFYGNFPGYLLLPPPQCVTEIKELVGLEKEKFYHHCTDEYLNFSKKHSTKIIPLAHVVQDEEIIPCESISKKARICVPGVLYANRREVLAKLKESKIPAVNKAPLHKVLDYLFKLRLVRYNQPPFENYHREAFIQLIAGSMLTYTEGSRLKILIKKFLEIPAYGSLLLCDPFTEHEQFGFQDGVNFIQCNVENIVDIAGYYLHHPEEAMTIAKRGQTLIMERHTSSALADTFKQMVSLASESKLHGAKWVNSKLCFQTQVIETNRVKEYA